MQPITLYHCYAAAAIKEAFEEVGREAGENTLLKSVRISMSILEKESDGSWCRHSVDTGILRKNSLPSVLPKCDKKLLALLIKEFEEIKQGEDSQSFLSEERLDYLIEQVQMLRPGSRKATELLKSYREKHAQTVKRNWVPILEEKTTTLILTKFNQFTQERMIPKVKIELTIFSTKEANPERKIVVEKDCRLQCGTCSGWQTSAMKTFECGSCLKDIPTAKSHKSYNWNNFVQTSETTSNPAEASTSSAK